MDAVKLSEKQQEMIEQHTWKRKFTTDEPLSKIYRTALVNLHIYPTGMISQKPIFDAEEAYNRVVLHQMIEELPREDLRAVEELVRVLVLFPEDVEGAVQLCQKRNKEDQARHDQIFPELRSIRDQSS